MKDNTFLDYNFPDYINQTLDDLKFVRPTPIQQKIIPLIRKKQNVVGVSNTGSGKSHAFILPILEGINTSLNKPQVIIMSPTRELAMQLTQNLMEFTKHNKKLKISLQIGGKNFAENKAIDAQVVVGTPGRLIDAINKRHVLGLDEIRYVVIDEADMIFDSNFINEADQVMANINEDVCFSIFSATITEDMYPFLKKYFDGVKVVDLGKGTNKKVNHTLVQVKNEDKFTSLVELLQVIDPYLCLIFASKKSDVVEIAQKLNSLQIKCIQLHGDLPSRERAKTLKRINNLEFKYVVASDIAARGIDIEGVSHVVSYDLPKELEYYLHRSGRTGRYQYTGESYLLYQKDDEKEIKKLEAKGIDFAYTEIKDKQLIPLGLRTRESKSKKDDNYDKNLVNKVTKKKAKVKPGYKKKRKQELEKIKKKERQQVIKLRIRAQRKKRKQTSDFSD